MSGIIKCKQEENSKIAITWSKVTASNWAGVIDSKLSPLSLKKEPNWILNKYGSCLVEFVCHINFLLRGYWSIVGNWIFFSETYPQSLVIIWKLILCLRY